MSLVEKERLRGLDMTFSEGEGRSTVRIQPPHHTCPVCPGPRSNTFSYPNIFLPILILCLLTGNLKDYLWTIPWAAAGGGAGSAQESTNVFYLTHRMISKNWEMSS